MEPHPYPTNRAESDLVKRLNCYDPSVYGSVCICGVTGCLGARDSLLDTPLNTFSAFAHSSPKCSQTRHPQMGRRRLTAYLVMRLHNGGADSQDFKLQHPSGFHTSRRLTSVTGDECDPSQDGIAGVDGGVSGSGRKSKWVTIVWAISVCTSSKPSSHHS